MSKDGHNHSRIVQGVQSGVLKNGGQPSRKLSHGDVATQQNNVFKRLRQSGTNQSSNSTTGINGRYSVVNQSSNNGPSGIRNIQIDKRLEQPNHHQQNSSFVMNKYANLHQNAHESNKNSGGLVNSTVNKSGQNLNSNFSKLQKSGVPQTQRNTHQQVSIGNSTGRGH